MEVAVPGLEGRQVAVLHLHAASAGHVTSAAYYCVKEVSVRQGTKCAMAQNTLEHQESAELLRTPFRGSSQNMIMVKFGPAPILLVA